MNILLQIYIYTMDMVYNLQVLQALQRLTKYW